MKMRVNFTKRTFVLRFLFLAICFVSLWGILPVSAATELQQQTITVTGTVKDNQGAAVIGVSIIAQDGRTGTTTDANGNFTLRVPEGSELSISFIGYQTQVVTAGREPIRIELVEESMNLDVVQVVAYGVQKKVSVTGAISAVGGEELTRTPISSPANVLSGLMTGITTVQYSGEPGNDAAEIFVRGKGTFTRDGATPLIQVDGVERSFNQIDPNEIESINVLKDASATAVFGVRGANGVILVTTKRGREGKAKINFSTSASLLIPTKSVELANAEEYATFYNMRDRLDGKPLSFTDAAIQKLRDHSDPIRFPDTDWLDYIMKDVTMQSQHNINISGGTSTVRYFVSGGLYTQGGMFNNFGLPYDASFQYKRYNYRTNLDIDATKTTTISFSIAGNADNSVRPQNGDGATGLMRNVYWSAPFSSPGIIDGKRVLAAMDYTDGVNLPFLGVNGIGYWGNGYWGSNKNRMNVDLALNQKLDFITRNLSFSVKGSYNSSFDVNKNVTSSRATYTPALKEDGTLGYKKNGQDTQASYDERRERGRNWYMEAALNWNRDFGEHHVSVLALYNQSKTYYPSQYSDIPIGYVGLVGRVTYDWKNRYMAEFNAGYNGSENFHPDRRFGFFPAGSVGWIVSEENFWKSVKPVVNYMKLRASWGLVGNDKVGGSRFMYTPDPYKTGLTSSFSGGNNDNNEGFAYYFGTNRAMLPGAKETSRNNPNVGWEKALKQNYGVDFAFLKERLSLSVDYYQEHRTDILVRDGTAPGIIGFAVPYANLGEVKSWGTELSLRWRDRIGQHANYYVGVNLSNNQNEILEMKETPQNYPWLYQKGHRIGNRSLFRFWRFYDEDTPELYEKTFGTAFPDHGVNLLPGDPVYVDRNNDGKIDPEDSGRDKGYTDDPQWIAGFNAGFTWKDLDVSMQWTGAWQVSRQLEDVFFKPFVSNTFPTQGGLLKYHVDHTWTEENPSQSALYPRPTTARESNTYRAHTLFNVNSSYLRLKSLQIAYNFHFPFMEKIKLDSFQLALSGYNLLTFTDYIWGDPESRASNSPSYPLQRSFSLTLKVGF
jgi:TonB-linked SusC/RagA family outer membrane protein